MVEDLREFQKDHQQLILSLEKKHKDIDSTDATYSILNELNKLVHELYDPYVKTLQDA